ncbi:MAG: hypothetical protein AAB845_00070 [Patescibacteria group bacterium]
MNEHEHEETNSTGAWVQENLRIIVSVFIVAAIALGIYSYSQRAEIASENEDIAQLLDTKGEEAATTEDGMTTEEGSDDTAMNKADKKDSVVITEELSQETESAFVEKAAKGDGTTHLARRALAHYLEKNTDSSLSAEHKVYIEDYLRKHAAPKGSMNPGASVEFSKASIKEAIESSKNLNQHQLNNLKQFSHKVSAYR